MSLFDLMPIETEPVTKPLKRPEYIVTIKPTRSGRKIMVCTAQITPQSVIDEACAKGLPLFNGGEIAIMRDCLPEMVEQIMKVKLEFPGCTVQQILSKGDQG